MYTLRLPGESNEQFAARAKLAAQIAKILVNACFANRCMLEYIANPELPCTEADLRISPTVRVEYEQAIAIGDLGSCLAAIIQRFMRHARAELADDTIEWYRYRLQKYVDHLIGHSLDGLPVDELRPHHVR